MRLYKSSTDKRIFGVCGGLGESFGIDPTIFRLILALLFMYRGAGFVLYVILGLILPYDYQVDRSKKRRPRPHVTNPKKNQPPRKDVTNEEEEDRRWSDF